jgi:hypothetical protein
LIETQDDSSNEIAKHAKLLGTKKKKFTKTSKPTNQAELDQKVQQVN